MEHKELALLRDRKDWNALWPEAKTRADYSIDQLAGSGTSDPKDSNYNDEVCQVAYEAAWKTLPAWDIEKGALDTHIKAQVQGAIHKYWNTEKTGGIGSNWVAEQGIAAEHVSMATEAGFDEEGGDMPTYIDELTYGDTDDVPAGYGNPEQELADESMDEAIAFYMQGLTPEEAQLMRSYIMGESTSREYAEETGVSHMDVQRTAKKILKQMFQKSKSLYVIGMGIENWKGLQSHYPVRKRYPAFWSDAEGMFTANPIWSEATGRVWNSWDWKPQLGDLPDLTLLRKFERAAQKRAA